MSASYFKSGKPQWARAWFSVFPQAKSSQFNLKQLPLRKTQNLAGIYIQHAGFGHWNTIQVKRIKNSYQIHFNGLYMGLNSMIYGPNIGEFKPQCLLIKIKRPIDQMIAKLTSILLLILNRAAGDFKTGQWQFRLWLWT